MKFEKYMLLSRTSRDQPAGQTDVQTDRQTDSGERERPRRGLTAHNEFYTNSVSLTILLNYLIVT